jgi:iron complex outermembrane receptor protein
MNSLKSSAALLPLLFTISPLGAQQTVGIGVGSEGASEVPSIVVQASRFEEQLADALPQTKIVTSAEIQKSGASNVSEVLSKVAGLPIRINLDGSTNAVVDMKGYGDTASNNVVILLDGVRLSENQQAAARTSMIPLEAIDHIEITKTGNSVLYGDGATGGTINIVTKRNVGNLTVVSGGLASYSGYQSSIYHSQALQSSEISLFAKQYASDNYRHNAKGNEFSTGANWVKHVDAQTDVGARFFASEERNKLPGALPLIYLNSSPRDTQVSGYNWDANVSSRSLTLFGKKTIDNIELAIDLNDRTRKNSDSYSYDAYDVYSGYHHTDWRQSYGNSSSNSQNQSLSPRVKVNNFVVHNNSLQVGYDWLKSQKYGQAFLTFGCSTAPCNVQNNTGGNVYQMTHKSNGLYFRDILDFSSVHRITAGYRKEDYSQNRSIDYGWGPSGYSIDGTASASELEYSRKLQPNLTGYLRLSRNFRIANADDNGNVAYAPTPVLLSVQTSKDIDVGLNHQSESSTTEVSYFHSDVKNEIGYDPSQYANVNFDPTKREGFNLRQRLMLSKAFTLRSNLQYVNAKFVEGTYLGKTIPSVANFSGNLSLDYRIDAKQQFTLTSRFAQGSFMSGDFSNSQSKIPGYVVEDMSYFYKEGNWSMVATIANITNKKYTDMGFYKSSYTVPYNLTVYPNSGRNFSLTGRYAF